MTRRRRKKEPVAWMGPTKSRGPGTSLGKGRWRVIDSTGQWIAAGFTTQAYALRWIDSFHLMRRGFQLSDDDHEWLPSHWYPALPARLAPETRAPTETSNANVLNPEETETEGVRRPLQTAAANPGNRAP
jgi:hypothetical protein